MKKLGHFGKFDFLYFRISDHKFKIDNLSYFVGFSRMPAIKERVQIKVIFRWSEVDFSQNWVQLKINKLLQFSLYDSRTQAPNLFERIGVPTQTKKYWTSSFCVNDYQQTSSSIMVSEFVKFHSEGEV